MIGELRGKAATSIGKTRMLRLGEMGDQLKEGKGGKRKLENG